MEGTLTGGKKVATGVISSSSNTSRVFSVSSLDFRPTVVMVLTKAPETTSDGYRYNAIFYDWDRFKYYTNTGKGKGTFVGCDGWGYRTDVNDNGIMVRGYESSGVPVIKDNGFTIYDCPSSWEMMWIAYE